MTKEQTLEALKQLLNESDLEKAHEQADDALCGFLIGLGYEDVVKEWEKIQKWYA